MELHNVKGIESIFATNSDFLIFIFLQPNIVDLRYFKLSYVKSNKLYVSNINGLQYQI